MHNAMADSGKIVGGQKSLDPIDQNTCCVCRCMTFVAKRERCESFIGE